MTLSDNTKTARRTPALEVTKTETVLLHQYTLEPVAFPLTSSPRASFEDEDEDVDAPFDGCDAEALLPVDDLLDLDLDLALVLVVVVVVLTDEEGAAVELVPFCFSSSLRWAPSLDDAISCPGT